MYDYFGIVLTPQTEFAMQHYLDNDPKKTVWTTQVHVRRVRHYTR